ncbi:hypothetical protein [Candidatus Enterovibrio altilux]|nr:hypothetical protein [Candidatus Enterovibrio luxaltus]
MRYQTKVLRITRQYYGIVRIQRAVPLILLRKEQLLETRSYV